MALVPPYGTLILFPIPVPYDLSLILCHPESAVADEGPSLEGLSSRVKAFKPESRDHAFAVVVDLRCAFEFSNYQLLATGFWWKPPTSVGGSWHLCQRENATPHPPVIPSEAL